MLTFATLCYLRRENRGLLQRKAQGLFGEGRWNAPGGKMLRWELPERAAAREMYEETALRVSGLHFGGILNFYLGESKQLDQTVFLFVCSKSTGRMRRSSEGELRWFSVDAIPYRDMWEDDRVWLPLLLDGKGFEGNFYFSENYLEFLGHEIYEMTEPHSHGV
jgi:8-oxo-dGTP pyrophosphatase MutT (NUDIX family)